MRNRRTFRDGAAEPRIRRPESFDAVGRERENVVRVMDASVVYETYVSSDDHVYYVHPTTREATWTRPPSFERRPRTSADWEIHQTSTDNIDVPQQLYFYDLRTRSSAWERPAQLSRDDDPTDARGPWCAYFDETSEREWYYNTKTKQRTYTVPSDPRTVYTVRKAHFLANLVDEEASELYDSEDGLAYVVPSDAEELDDLLSDVDDDERFSSPEKKCVEDEEEEARAENLQRLEKEFRARLLGLDLRRHSQYDTNVVRMNLPDEFIQHTTVSLRKAWFLHFTNELPDDDDDDDEKANEEKEKKKKKKNFKKWKQL